MRVHLYKKYFQALRICLNISTRTPPPQPQPTFGAASDARFPQKPTLPAITLRRAAAMLPRQTRARRQTAPARLADETPVVVDSEKSDSETTRRSIVFLITRLINLSGRSLLPSLSGGARPFGGIGQFSW